MDNKQKKVVAIIGIIFVLLIVWAMFSIFKPQIPEVETAITKASFSTRSHPVSDPINKDGVIFSNGRYFVRYNLISGESKKIGPDVKLPELGFISVSPNGKFILFKSSRQSYDDYLGEKLDKEGIYKESAYWWVLDIEQNDYRFLGQNIALASFTEDSNLITVNETGGEEDFSSTIKEVSPDLKNEFSSTSLRLRISNAYKVGETYFIGTFDGNIYQYSEGNEQKRITNQPGFLSGLRLSPDYRYLTFSLTPEGENVQEETVKSTGYIIDLSNLKEVLKDNAISGLSWSSAPDTIAYLNEGGDAVVVKNLDSKDAKSYKLGDISVGEGGAMLVSVVGEDTFVFSDIGNYFSASSRQLAVQTVDQKYKKDLGGNGKLEYLPTENAFLVTSSSIGNAQLKKKVYETLRRDGINPDIYKITFTQVGGVNNHGVRRR